MKTPKTPARRNAVIVAMNRRYGRTTKSMRDRRAARGGCRNKQQEYQEGW